MPRYFFHLRGGWEDQEDYLGRVLPDGETAEKVALVAAKMLLRQASYADDNIERQQWFEIADGSGELQAIVPISAAELLDDATFDWAVSDDGPARETASEQIATIDAA